MSLDGREYVVRKTADWEVPLMLIRPAEEEISFERVYVRSGDGTDAEAFLMRNGLSGCALDDEWLRFPAGCSLALFPGVTAVYLLKKALEERRYGESRWERGGDGARRPFF